MDRLVVTNKGKELVAKVVAGSANIRFFKMSTSDYDYSNIDVSELVELSNVKQEIEIDEVKLVGSQEIEIKGVVHNEAVEEGYCVRCIGLYAKSDDEEVLYAVSIADNPDYMPAYGQLACVINVEIITKIENADKVEMFINPMAVVTVEEFNNHINDYDNPHKVSKSQVGLSNVQNYNASSEVNLDSDTTYATSRAVKNVNVANSTALNGISTKIDSSSSETIAKINSKGNETITRIDSKASEVVSRIDSKASEVISRVDNKTNEVLTRIENKTTTVLNQINNKSVIKSIQRGIGYVDAKTTNKVTNVSISAVNTAKTFITFNAETSYWSSSSENLRQGPRAYLTSSTNLRLEIAASSVFYYAYEVIEFY